MKRISKRALALLCAAVLLLGAIPFTASVTAATSYVFFENFEQYDDNETVPGWTVFNTDGDAYTWYIDKDFFGEVSYISTSANSNGRVYPDEYLTLPAITIPTSIEAKYSFSLDVWAEYPWSADHFSVYVSTTPITDPTALTSEQQILSEDIWGGYNANTFTCDLNVYRGQTLYFAIRHHDASGAWQFHVDNVAVIAEEADRHDVEFEIDSDILTIVPVNGAFEVIDGQDYAFAVEVSDTCNAENGTLTVKANGKELTAVDGVYTIPAVTEDQEVEAEFRYMVGDIDGSGVVDLADATQLFYHINGLKDFDSVERAAANIDTFAELNSSDMTALFYYITGMRAYVDENMDISLLWKNTYADSKNGFLMANTIESADYYLDRRQVKDFSATANSRDGKAIFYRNGKSRVVNLSDGYAFSLPFTDFEADYSLSALRSRYENDSFVLNVSEENSNPYGNNQNGWNTYSYEWLMQCVTEDSFLSRNNLSRTHAKVEANTTMLSGYLVWRYDILINDAQDIDMPYYSIAIIRKENEYVNFHLMVMKSTTDQAATMNAIVKSFKEVTPIGVSQNEQVAFACEPDKNWNAETAAYYEKLVTQETTDWGIFTESMSDTSASSRENLTKEYADMTSRLDFEYDIMPTYTHIAWGNTMHYFPSSMAADFAGGNGFNGKPVLQFTYQFTTNNNGNVKASATPMFDVARGVYDEHFRTLARDIKAYGKPVLFRLNNEMNTDWTSYCGMVTLLDPDFFALTWERLYNIFEDEGVDNCIWIFNPIATTTPYCSWGEDLCYLPDLDTVHVLGLTAYEMGNGSSLASFEKMYRELYEKNSPYFTNYPHIISEFAAGAGGEKQYDYGKNGYVNTTLGRNAQKQAAWVEAMFDCFAKRDQSGYEFCRNIKGAVWFGVNDYATIDGMNYIVNYLEIHDASTEAFKKGLALHP